MSEPDSIKKLVDFFTRLPGVGPRQAARFAYFLTDEDENVLQNLKSTLDEILHSITRCSNCHRVVEKHLSESVCKNCKNSSHTAILVVEKDQDLDNIEKTGAWHESYHILGGTISLLGEMNTATKRIKKLYERADKLIDAGIKPEIIIATSATTDGDTTALYIERVLDPFISTGRIKLSRLGRGLSTGSELEYADPQTIKNALQNRK